MEVAGKRLETDNVAEFCESCATENLSKPADGFCKDCNEFMCQKCFRHHLKAKLCRDHVLDPLNGASSQITQRIREEKCKKHAQETIKYYCRIHNVVGCGDCIVSDHQKCDTEFIKDLAKNYEESSEFKTLLRHIQKWETDKAENETRIETNRKANKTLLDNALKDIRNFRTEITNWFDKMENNLEAEVRNISDENEKQMSMLEEKIKTISSEIDSIKEQLDSKVYHADNLFIRHVECTTRIGEVEKTLSQIKPDNMIKSFTFEPETKVKDMYTSAMNLGIIRYDSVMKADEKQMTDTESSANEVYKLPDPRAAGFAVGKRVRHRHGTTFQGTVTAVGPKTFSVKWDSGFLYPDYRLDHHLVYLL